MRTGSRRHSIGDVVSGCGEAASFGAEPYTNFLDATTSGESGAKSSAYREQSAAPDLRSGIGVRLKLVDMRRRRGVTSPELLHATLLYGLTVVTGGSPRTFDLVC